MKSGRTQLIILMLISFVTLGASYLLFYNTQNGAVWGTTNNGTFVKPVTSIAQLGWVSAGSAKSGPYSEGPKEVGLTNSDVDALRTGDGHWWLWITATSCDQTCDQAVQDMRALHILLNKQSDRVLRGFTQRAGGKMPGELKQRFPALSEILVAQQTAGDFSLEDGIYIVDPNGNLVFHYALNVNPKLVLEDLKKLLKVSQIG